jgi:hypothetical protein
MNVARIAGIDATVISRASYLANQVQEGETMKHILLKEAVEKYQ